MADEKTQLDQIQETVEVLARHLKPLPEQVTRLEKKVDGLGSELKSFRAETDGNFVEVNDRIDTLETTVRRHDVEISSRRKAA